MGVCVSLLVCFCLLGRSFWLLVNRLICVYSILGLLGYVVWGILWLFSLNWVVECRLRFVFCPLRLLAEATGLLVRLFAKS